MNIAGLLRRWLPHSEIGYKDKGEEFTTRTLFKNPWFSICLHRLVCPKDIDFCHDHPWWFMAFIIYGGYFEQLNGGPIRFRPPGSLLYRTEHDIHNVWTTKRANWSILIKGKKTKDWKGDSCRNMEKPAAR